MLCRRKKISARRKEIEETLKSRGSIIFSEGSSVNKRRKVLFASDL
jgi:hypothetical protein